MSGEHVSREQSQTIRLRLAISCVIRRVVECETKHHQVPLSLWFFLNSF